MAINTTKTDVGVCFYNNKFDREMSSARLYARAMLEPVAFGFLGVMVLSLFSVLERSSPLIIVVAGSAVVLLLSRIRATTILQREPAFLRIRGEFVSHVSLLQAADEDYAAPWEWITGIKVESDSALVSIGQSVLELKKADWAEWNELIAALRQASRRGSTPLTV